MVRKLHLHSGVAAGFKLFYCMVCFLRPDCRVLGKIMMRTFICCLIFFIVASSAAAGAQKPDSTVYYSIHNGSYRTEKNARDYVSSISKTRVPVFIKKVQIPGKGTWFRVYIGRYRDLEEANRAFPVLKKKNIKGLGDVKKFAETNVGAFEFSDAKASPEKPEQKIKPVKMKNGGGIPPVSVVEKSETRTASTDPVLDKARKFIHEGGYREAIALLDDYLNQKLSVGHFPEAALRLRAEVWYESGMKGDRQALLKAVDDYKALFSSYPDPRAGNDGAYSNMARCYEKLSFFYEAAGAWEAIVLYYPDSKHAEEAFFQSGYALIDTGKKQKIYERLIRYTKKYPDGAFTKMAFYTIGNVLAQMNQCDQAVKWFDSARRKWPDMADLPAHVLDSMGSCYLSMARYREAFDASSVQANLYPQGGFGKNALFIMSQAADKEGYADLAVKLYGLFIERYPQSKEAWECALAQANLGVENPGINVSKNLGKIDSYLDPLQAYDTLQRKGGKDDVERVMFWRGKALEKKGDIPGALENYGEMLNMFPQGKFINDVRRNMKKVTVGYIDSFYEKGDYAHVADLYFKLRGKISFGDNFKTGFRIGRSLQQIGVYREALSVYSKLVGNRKDGTEDELLIAFAEVHIAMRDAVAAEYKLRQLSAKGVRDAGKILPSVMRKLADLYLELGNHGKAAGIYAKLLGKGKVMDPALLLNYGRCLKAKKMTDEAQKYLLRALASCEHDNGSCENNTLSGIFHGLGDVYSGQKSFEKGLAMYRKALEYTTDRETKRWLLLKIGKLYSAMDKTGAAEKNFSAIKEISDGDFWPGVADFFISQKSGNTEDGRGRQ